MWTNKYPSGCRNIDNDTDCNIKNNKIVTVSSLALSNASKNIEHFDRNNTLNYSVILILLSLFVYFNVKKYM